MNKRKLTVAQRVDKLFKVFGPGGRNWTPNAACCLLTGQHKAFGGFPLNIQIRRKLGELYWQGGIAEFNDSSTWPRIRRFLNAIKYRKPFKP